MLFSEEHPLLTSFSRELFAFLYEQLCALDVYIEGMEQRMQRVFAGNERCQRIAAVAGLGLVIFGQTASSRAGSADEANL